MSRLQCSVRSCSSRTSELAAKSTSGEWPRRYAPEELDAIAASIAPYRIDARNIERLQGAVEAFQWASDEDSESFREQFPASTSKGRRRQFERIIELCDRGAPESEIEIILKDLDGKASELLGPVGIFDHLKLKEAAELALANIFPRRGPDPRNGRQQFCVDLGKIFLRITGRRPGRSVFDQEQGDFTEFVKAALGPFPFIVTQGYPADIKAALAQLKRRKRPKV
jgi:hypothetical protein